MILNPNQVIERGIINVMSNSANVQPNGIDLNVEQLEEILDGGSLGKVSKNLPEYRKIQDPKSLFYELEKGKSYLVTFKQKVKLPSHVCARIIGRSTLNRMGGFVTSGLFDSGFNGNLGCALHCDTNIYVECGARLAQVIFMAAESAHLYDGQYQSKE